MVDNKEVMTDQAVLALNYLLIFFHNEILRGLCGLGIFIHIFFNLKKFYNLKYIKGTYQLKSE